VGRVANKTTSISSDGQVPRSLHLSASAAKNSLLAPVMDAVLAATGGDESGVLALYLLHERAIGAASEFSPYLAVLPTAAELDVPILWSVDIIIYKYPYISIYIYIIYKYLSIYLSIFIYVRVNPRYICI